MNRGTQLTCINTTKEYQPTKHSTPVRIHTSAGGRIYKELGVELKTDKINKEVPTGPTESFEQLHVLAEQPAWISDLIKFVTFARDQRK